MKIAIGDKVTYLHPKDSFPPSGKNGKTYTGVVTDAKAITEGCAPHDRATIQIDPNPDYLIQIECNQRFIELQ